MPPLLWHVLFERSLSLSLFAFDTRRRRRRLCVSSSSSFVSLLSFVFGLPKHTQYSGEKKRKKG